MRKLFPNKHQDLLEEINDLKFQVNALEMTQNDYAITMGRQTFTKNFQQNSTASSGCPRTEDAKLDKMFGYPDTPHLNDYIKYYRRYGVANTIVRAFPDECWKTPPRISDDIDANEPTTFEKAVDEYLKSINFLMYAKRADVLSQLNSFSVILIGFNDSEAINDGEFVHDETVFSRVVGWDKPVEAQELDKERPINYLIPYVFGPNVFINQYYQDPSTEKFNTPQMYTINTGTGYSQLSGFDVIGSTSNIGSPISTSTLPAVSMQVHESRVIHIAYEALQNDVWGKPILEKCYDTLLDLKKVTGGDAEIFKLSGRGGVVFTADKDINIDKRSKSEAKAALDEYSSDQNRYLMIEGFNPNVINFNHPNTKDSFETHARKLSSDTQIPMSRLFSAERGELRGDQDEKNFLSKVVQRQSEFCEPVILRPFVDKLIELGIVPEPQGGEYEVVWPRSDTTTPTDKAKNFNVSMTGLAAVLNTPDGNMLIQGAIDEYNRVTDGDLKIEETPTDEPDMGESNDIPENRPDADKNA